MRLRARLGLTVAAAASVAIFVMAFAFWVLAAREQRQSVDESLLRVVRQPRSVVQEIAPNRGRGRGFEGVLVDEFAGDTRLFTRIRLTGPDGQVLIDQGLPFVEASAEPRIVTVEVDGERFRMAVARVGGGRNAAVLQVARNVEDVEDGLDRLRQQIVFGSLLGVGLAGLLGALVAHQLSKPITEVAGAARQLARRQDLPSRLDVDRTDEVGDLARSFNQMLAALEVSREQQQRLVADASHELRTPLTSLRLKIDLLDSTPDLPSSQREELLAGAAIELERLTDLVAELVDLASDPTVADEPVVVVDLGSLAGDVAERARRSTGRTIRVTSDRASAPVRERMVRRALSNLLDNATKYSAHGTEIDVIVEGGRFEVKDRGSGIPTADLDHVFDRFFRSPEARTQPGNGIGLAIVQRVAELHRGTVWARNRQGGGAAVGFSVHTGPLEE